MKICPECRTTYHENTPVCRKEGASLLELGDDDARCGTVIDGRFLILGRLGEGGMGTVYRAWQFSTSRLVALKLLIAAFTDNKTAVERFMREARVTAGLNSPHVVRVYDFGQLEDGTAYMAMELVDGVPLDALIDGPMAPERAMELVRQICIALEEAHGQGLVHRDLKPGNIMVRQLADGGDFAQVLDFGIAKILDETRTALTAENQNPGTPAYMSPEQARNETIGPPTDLYALSVIFFEMLVGERPFTGTSAMSVLLQHVQKAPPSLQERLPDLPRVEAIDAVLQRGLAKDPTVRYGTADALRTELDMLKSGADPDALSNPIARPDEGKRKFGFNLQALGCSVQLAVAVGALALFILPAMRDGSDRFLDDDAPQATHTSLDEDTRAGADRAPNAESPPKGDAPPKPEPTPGAERKAAPADRDAPAIAGGGEALSNADTDPAPERPTAGRGMPEAERAKPGFGVKTPERNERKDADREEGEALAGAPPPPAEEDSDDSDRADVDDPDDAAGAPAKTVAAPAPKVRPAEDGAQKKAKVPRLRRQTAGAQAAQPARATEAEVRRALLALRPRIRGRCGPGPWPVEVLVGLDGAALRVRITQPGRAAHGKARCVLKIIRDGRYPMPAKPMPMVLTL